MRIVRWVGALLVFLATIIAVAWAFGAIWFDAPFGANNGLRADCSRPRSWLCSCSLGHSGGSWPSFVAAICRRADPAVPACSDQRWRLAAGRGPDSVGADIQGDEVNVAQRP